MTCALEGLLDLPIDILLNILICLEPKEILVLRSCNKALRQVTYDRLLWQQLLQRTHKQQKVYLDPSAPYRMTQEELEHAALRPHRFISSLLGFDTNSFLKPITTWDLPPPPYIDDVDLEIMAGGSIINRYTDALLVSGGRYMFTVFGGRVVTLWDLEPQHEAATYSSLATIPSLESGIPVSIGSISATALHLSEDESIEMKDWVIAPDGKGLYLELMIMHSESWTSRRTQICKIDPLLEAPSFKAFASRDYPGHYDTCLQGGNLVMLEQSSITIWDYENDRSVSWQVGPTKDKTMIALDGFVMMIHRDTGHFEVWKTPAVSDFRQGNNLVDLQPCQSSNIFSWSEDPPDVLEINVGLPKGSSVVSGIAGTMESSVPDSQSQFDLFNLYIISSEAPNASTAKDGKDGPTINIQRHSSIEIDAGSRMYSAFHGVGSSCILPLARGLRQWDEEYPNMGMDLHVTECIRPRLDIQKPHRQNIVRLEEPPIPVRYFDLCPVSARTTSVMRNGVVQVSQYIP